MKKSKMLNQKIFFIGSPSDIKYSKNPLWERFEYPKDGVVRFIEKDLTKDHDVFGKKVNYGKERIF